MNPLEFWWIGVLLGGPVAALFGGKALRRALSARARLACGLGAVAVLGLAFTPVSSPGIIADQIVLGLAYVAIWLWLGSSPAMVRYGTVALFAALVGVSFVRVWPLIPLVFIAGDVTRSPLQTVRLDCHRAVRMTRYNWTTVTKVADLLAAEHG